MAPLEDFETLLKEVVKAKRLSASKITKLTEIAIDCMEDDTQLVSLLFRTHKSLPPTAKVSSLYVFDALSRKARSQAKRAGSSSAASEKGNCATFLTKMEGILEGLFRDMASVGTPEAKEKTQKILDLWAKGNTFPSTVLSRLADIVKQASQVETVPSDGMSVVPPSTTPPGSPPPRHAVQSEIPKTNAADHQATLLALLTKAAQVVPNGHIVSQTPPLVDATQTGPSLHQTYHTSSAPSHTPPIDTSAQNSAPFPSRPTDPRRPRQPSPDRRDHLTSRGGYGPRDYQRTHSPRDKSLDYSNHEQRGFDNGHPAYTYRGQHQDQNGQGFHSNSPIHDRFRNGRGGHVEPHLGPDQRGSKDVPRPMDPRRRRRSRSASPRRSPADPPRAPLLPAQNVQQGTNSSAHPKQAPQPSAVLDTTAPNPNTQTPSFVQPPASSVAMSPSAAVVASEATEIKHVSLPAPVVPVQSTHQGGLENFNITSFDFTNPASWMALGKMWEVTNGKAPSQEELIQFISISSAALQQPEMWASGGSSVWQDGVYSQEMHMNGAQNRYQRNADTDAIILGQPDNTQLQPSSSGEGQQSRGGDGWQFNRNY